MQRKGEHNMIENKEEYISKRAELSCKKEVLVESIDCVDAVIELIKQYNIENLSELKEKLEAEYDAAEEAYDEYTKEESDTFDEICKKFSANQIECWFAQGRDVVDLVNSYLSGELK